MPSIGHDDVGHRQQRLRSVSGDHSITAAAAGRRAGPAHQESIGWRQRVDDHHQLEVVDIAINRGPAA